MIKKICILIFILVGCSQPFISDGDFFYISREDAVLPVWVRGKKDSGVFIVYIHGGPGGSALGEATTNCYSLIEEEFAIVYWDQRGSGASDGNPAILTNRDISMDLDLLIEVLKDRYNPDKIILAGHSYGVTLIGDYFSMENRTSDIHSIIAIDGVFNLKMNWRNSIEWVKSKTSDEDALVFYSSIGENFSNNSQVQKHINTYVNDLKGLYISQDTKSKTSPQQVFFSPLDLGVLSNPKRCQERLKNWWLSDYSTSASNIDHPILIIRGSNDGLFPEESIISFYDSINGDDKKMVTIEGSAHHPFFSNKEVFSSEVISFINSN